METLFYILTGAFALATVIGLTWVAYNAAYDMTHPVERVNTESFMEALDKNDE